MQRTTLKLDDTFSFNGTDMTRPEMLRSVETVRRMTIADKIRFWRDVMQYAHDRGIAVYLFTWNIFTFGATGKYGITPAQDNPITIDYFRKSVRETVLTYPLLAGMGITAGEEMKDRKDEFAKEPWLWKTYGEGIRDALKLQPGPRFPPHPPLPPDRAAADPGSVQALSVALRPELQILGGAHALFPRAAVRQGVAGRVARQSCACG